MDGEQFLKASGLQLCPDNQMPIITDSKGNFIAMKFDLAKPGNFYYVLNKYLNVMQGEAGYQLPALFTLGVNQIGFDNATITIKGNSPKMTDNTIYAIPEVQSADGGVSNIIFPMDMFRVPGKYSFIFQVNQNGNIYKTAPFILNVEPEMISISANFKNGVTPYDSVFDAWRAKLNTQFQTIQDEADHLQTLFNQYQTYADGVITQKLTDVPKLDGNNTYTGTNSFNNVDLKSLSLNGTDITNGLIKGTNYINGTLINGVTYWYANLYQIQFANQTVAILAAVMNIPNNSTFQNAKEASPVSVVQFPKGTLATVGQTYITLSGAQFKLNKSTDTLDFVGLINTDWTSWGRAIRDTAVII